MTTKAKLLLELARELGLTMGGTVGGRHIGWSHDREACIALYRQGAEVTRVTTRTEGFEGYDVSFPVGAVAEPRDGVVIVPAERVSAA